MKSLIIILASFLFIQCKQKPPVEYKFLYGESVKIKGGFLQDNVGKVFGYFGLDDSEDNDPIYFIRFPEDEFRNSWTIKESNMEHVK